MHSPCFLALTHLYDEDDGGDGDYGDGDGDGDDGDDDYGDGDGDGGDGDGDGDVANLSVTGGDKNRVRGKGEASTLCAKLRLGERILRQKDVEEEDDIYARGVMKVKVSR